MRRGGLALIGVLAAALAAAACVPIASRDVVITLDPGERHQTMTGWEVIPRMWEDDKPADRFNGGWIANRDEILDRLIDDAGVNRVRLEIRSGTENPVDWWSRFASGRTSYTEFQSHRYEKVNDDVDPRHADPAGFHFSELDYRVENYLLPLMKRAAARGRKFTLNLCYMDFKWGKAQGPLSHAAAPEEYAELIALTFERLKTKYGLSPDYLELILEPDNTVGWRGAEIGRAAVVVSERLKAAGFTPKLIAPSTSKARLAVEYFDAATAVPGAERIFSTLAYHRYDGRPTANAALAGIRARARASGVPAAMLEYVDGDIEDLFADLTEADASAWEQWASANRKPEKGKPSPGWLLLVDERAPAGKAVSLSAPAARLSQVFRFVDFGAVRIGARADDSDTRAVAFENPDGRLAATAILKRKGRVTVKGLRPGRYGARLATDEGALLPLPTAEAANGELTVEIPEAGVLAVYALP